MKSVFVRTIRVPRPLARTATIFFITPGRARALTLGLSLFLTRARRACYTVHASGKLPSVWTWPRRAAPGYPRRLTEPPGAFDPVTEETVELKLPSRIESIGE